MGEIRYVSSSHGNVRARASIDISLRGCQARETKLGVAGDGIRRRDSSKRDKRSLPIGSRSAVTAMPNVAGTRWLGASLGCALALQPVWVALDEAPAVIAG